MIYNPRSEPRGHEVTNPPDDADGTACQGVVLRMADQMGQRGVKFAEASGSLSVQGDDVASVSAAARACARAVTSIAYSPESDHADRGREARFHELASESRKLAELVQHSNVRRREDSRDASRKRAVVGDKPAPPTMAMRTTAAVVAITLAPTLRDMVFATLVDDLASWMLSILFAGLIGVMIVAGLFSGGHDKARPKTALAAGLLVGGSFLILRLSTATSLESVLFASSMSIMEAGAIVLLDRTAADHRESLVGWRSRCAEAAEAEAQADTSAAEDGRLVAEQQRVRAAIEAHFHLIDDRRALCGDPEHREDLNELAARLGYLLGIKRNNARIIP